MFSHPTVTFPQGCLVAYILGTSFILYSTWMVAPGSVGHNRGISHPKKNVRKSGLLFAPSHAYFNLTFKHIFKNHLCRVVSVKTSGLSCQKSQLKRSQWKTKNICVTQLSTPWVRQRHTGFRGVAAVSFPAPWLHPRWVGFSLTVLCKLFSTIPMKRQNPPS